MPSTALQKIFYGNDEFVKEHKEQEFTVYENEQHPTITLLTCCDSRVQKNAFNFDPIDQVFAIRNIGNQLEHASGSIDFGVHKLNTPLLLILGHTRCGAIKAAMGDYSSESAAIVNELKGLHPSEHAISSEENFEEKWLRAVEENVDQQVEIAMQRYSDDVAEGKLAVVGCVYDFVNHYGRGRGRIILRNLNGSTDSKTMHESSILQDLDEAVRDQIII